MSVKYSKAELELARVKVLEESNLINKTKCDSLQALVLEKDKQLSDLESKLGIAGMNLRNMNVERNNFKKRSESLGKELNRICKNGRTMEEVERIISNEESLHTEIKILKSQKAAALRDLEKSQSYCNELIIAQSSEGRLDLDAIHALQQKADYERIIASLMETLSAKDLQLSSLKEANLLLNMNFESESQKK